MYLGAAAEFAAAGSEIATMGRLAKGAKRDDYCCDLSGIQVIEA